MLLGEIGLFHHLLDDGGLGVPNLVGVMFYPSRFREILLKRLLSHCDDRPLMIKQDRARTGRSLVDS